MGFFFQEEKTLNKKQKSLSLAYENGCISCPLHNAKHVRSPQMKPTGSDKPELYILGEAPGENEDIEDCQFIGKSGELIRKVLKDITGKKFYDNKVRWNNVIRCWPGKGNRNPTEIEIRCCQKELELDIERTKPKIVVCVGNIALQAMLGVSGITSWRGRFIPKKVGSYTFWLAPILHPSFIIRQGGNKYNKGEYIDKTYLHTFEMDFREIHFALAGLGKPKVIDSGYEDDIELILGDKSKDVDKILKTIDRFKNLERVTLDIETAGTPSALSPYNEDVRMLSIALGTDDYTVAFPIEARVFNRIDEKRILSKLKELITTVKYKVAHNVKFEIAWFNKYFGTEAVMQGVWEDTMAMAVVLDERPGTKEDGGVLNLGTQTLINFGFNLKNLTKDSIDRKHLELADTKKLLMYNAMDSKYEHLLYKKLKGEIPTESEWVLHHLNKLARTLALTEGKGVLLDYQQAEQFSKDYDKTANNLMLSIKTSKEVKEFVKLTGKQFLPTSTQHITTLFRDIMKLEAVKGTTKKGISEGGFSTDKEAMELYAGNGVKLAKTILEHRKVQKQKSTYVDGVTKFVSKDGIVRASFNHLFVITGRLSSQNPNMQNFPKRQHVEARNIIKAPDDYWIVAIDFAQLEARVVAMVAQDREFMKMFWEGYDIHMDWAKRLSKKLKLKLDGDGLKKYRSLVKNQWVFPLIYGSSQESAEAGLGAKAGQLTKEYNTFWEMCNGVAEWQKEQLKFYSEYGFVQTLLGRKRHRPLSKNEIYNTPIQSLASDIVTDAMNRLSEAAEKLNKPQYQAIWNIHDDLGFYVPDETLEEDILFIAEKMVCSPFDFVNIPLGVEVSVGKRWGELEEVMKYDTLTFNPEFITKKLI